MTNREFFLQCRSTDVPLFVGVFNAVPEGQLGWRPEPKARTARELLGHLIGHEHWPRSHKRAGMTCLV